MKKIINITIITVITIILTISLLIALSNNITAAGMNLSNTTTTEYLARLIATEPSKMMNASISEIFGLNKKNSGTGLAVASNSSTGAHEIWYHSAACIFHTQASSPDGYKVKLTNVIDIEAPGQVTVYKYNGIDSSNNVKYSTGEVLDFTTDTGMSKICELLNEVDVGDDTVDNNYKNRTKYQNMRISMAGFAYSLYQSSAKGTGASSANSEDAAKDVIDYLWKKAGNYTAIRNYMEASGALDSYYYNAEGKNNSATVNQTNFNNIFSAVDNLKDAPILNKEETSPTVTYQNGKAYIGPLKVTCSGGTTAIKINTGTKWISADGWVTKNNNGTFGSVQKGTLTGNVFYAVTSENNVKNLTDVNVKVTLTYDTYKARIILATNKASNGQNLMFYRGEKATNNMEVDWTIGSSAELTIQKLDKDNKKMTVSGIKFEVYDSNNKKVGTLTTNDNGVTNSIALKANTSYTIKETYNPSYGYKDASITYAAIQTGRGTVSTSGGITTVKLQKSATMTIRNSTKIGTLHINKYDENGEKQENVKFVLYKPVSANKGYIQLYNEEGFVNEINGEVNINNYTVKYVSNDNISSATKFVTNSSGRVVIYNLERYSGINTPYTYTLREYENEHFGYKGLNATAKYSGGTTIAIENDGDIPFSLTNTTTTLNITNEPKLDSLEILKVGSSSETPLENVKFKIRRGTNEYLQLYDVTGLSLPLEGEVTINKDNVAVGSQYSVKYVTNKDEGTTFITNSSGKIIINNLEVDSSRNGKYSYTAEEINNPNHGYGSAQNASKTGSITELKSGTTDQIKISNTRALGNIKLEKYDEDNRNIMLSDVGFTIDVKPSTEKTFAYLAVYDKSDTIVQSVRGNVTINSNNIANDNEFRLDYYYTDKLYKDFTVEEQKNVTIFLTGDDGTLTINNLEMYDQKTSSRYKYHVKEVSNANYGYDIESGELTDIQITSGLTTTKQLSNKLLYTNLSGYVWIENSDGKANEYDNIYTDNGEDRKLTDLYILSDGELIKNTNAEISVEIKLRNKETGEIIKSLPDEFDETGKYTFRDIRKNEIENYEVVFVYDGLYYTTVVEKLDEDNGSKVKEVATERETLNNKFAVIKDNNELVTTSGATNTITYDKDNGEDIDGNAHTSQIVGLSIDTNIEATTNEASYNLRERYNTIKANSNTAFEALDNVNMGIVLREQPKLAIGSDIYSVYVEVNNKGYTYNYNGRQAHYNNLNNDEVGVKFEQENTLNRYTRTVYSSDVEALQNGTATMRVYITYKLQLFNQSKTLTSKVYDIKNYYDSSYTIADIYGDVAPEQENAETNSTHVFTVVETEENVEIERGEGVEENDKSYNSAKININGEDGIELKAGESRDIYIKFNISTEAIIALLTGNSTYHNATEIMNYSTYYGEGTNKSLGEMYSSDNTEKGKLYAGIDKASQPGNIKLRLIKAEGTSGSEDTPILDTSEFEDDTTSSPSLLLEATEVRKISGTVWEDATTYTEEQGRLGDGIYDEENEKLISGVKVTLFDVNTNDIAKYSDGVTYAQTITDDAGNYTLGYYDEVNNKYVGILPGEYIIKYNYGTFVNENSEEINSYIVNAEDGNIYINPNDYKSTIISSESNVLKEAFETNEDLRWYVTDEGKRYSDARDDISLRAEYSGNIDQNNFTIKNSTYNDLAINNMEAYTPIMQVSIEFTKEDEISALKEDNSPFEFQKEFENIDFGIAGRSRIDITIDKNITGLEIISQTGASIVSKGNPSDLNSKMQYVKKLDDLVYVEIESDMLQGAQLNLEYSITVINNSETDYLDEDYYFYGIKTEGTPKTIAKVKKVVDYLDATLTLDTEQTEDGIWQQITVDDLSGYVSEANVKEELKTGNYHIFLTDAFDDMGTGEERTVKLYALKVLATTDSVVESNGTEIVEISGVRIIRDSVPGNYNPSGDSSEEDEDKVDVIITPPTGTTVNYILYIIAAITTFVILALGIVIIKNKVVK